jgi:predicted MPP superfamily phosphohydrolase
VLASEYVKEQIIFAIEVRKPLSIAWPYLSLTSIGSNWIRPYPSSVPVVRAKFILAISYSTKARIFRSCASAKAFADVPAHQVTIVLIHNPRGVEHISEFEANAVVSGHTHGRRTRPSAGRPWKIRERRFHTGMYEVEGKKLYVNRGLGRVGRTRLNVRPEITVYTLR